MLKREIEYEDFNGETVKEVFYFNMSKPELIELEIEYNQGFGTFIEKIVETKDSKALMQQFKQLVLMAYGQKSDDGKRFIKSDTIREEFAQTAAYNALFMELATDSEAAVIFMKGILPKDLVVEADKAEKAITSVPPLPPTTSS